MKIITVRFVAMKGLAAMLTFIVVKEILVLSGFLCLI